MSVTEKQLHEAISDYQENIFALLAFANCYCYDYQAEVKVDGVKLFHGRKLKARCANKKGKIEERDVTPDLGIVLLDNTGVIAEVKTDFPQNREHWMGTFEQLMKYDDVLLCWPTDTGTVTMHDIVLILPQIRMVDVRDYYREHSEDISFVRPFTMVEFERTADKCIFLRVQEGMLTHTSAQQLLRSGKKISLDTLEDVFSVKLLDHEPPLPYMMGIIWSQIVARRAADMPGYQRCTHKRPLAVPVRVDELTEELHKGFTFNGTHSGDPTHQPKLPPKKWVQRACEAFVAYGMARWDEDDKGRLYILFHKKLIDVYSHFVGLCSRQPVVKAGDDPKEQLSFDDMLGTQPGSEAVGDALPEVPEKPKETAGVVSTSGATDV